LADRLVLTAHDYFLTCPNGGYFVYPRQSPCELRPGGWQCLVTQCDRRHYGHKLWRFVRHQIRRSLLDLAHSKALVLAVHDGLVPYLLRAGVPGEQVRVLRNPAAAWQPRRVAAGHNTDFFFIGRVDEDKGADLFADALALTGLPGQVIGAGALSEPLARSHPGLRIHGWQARDRIAELAADARAVVLPTRCRETFGIVALEALMSGIPVIVSHNSPFAGEIATRQFGLACDPGNEAALAGALRTVLGDDLLVRTMSERAFAEARQLAPTPAQWCDSLLALYRGRLAERVTRAIHPARADGLAAAGGPG
jgi:glycosyltransferase involved in cell wall biosynthesis